MTFSTHDPYDAEWEHPDTGRTAANARDIEDEYCDACGDARTCETCRQDDFPIGTVVMETIDGVEQPSSKVVVGYWRGYITVEHTPTGTTHKADPRNLRVIG